MRLGPLGPLFDRIRTQALSLERKPAPRPADESAGEAVGSGHDARRALVSAIAAIPRDAPDRRRRAFRAFLQATIARELRLQDPSAPASQELVDRVLSAMEEQEELRPAIEKAMDELLRRLPHDSTP